MHNEDLKHQHDMDRASGLPDWPEQIRLLSEIGDFVTQGLTLEELLATVYGLVNQLMDAEQFAVQSAPTTSAGKFHLVQRAHLLLPPRCQPNQRAFTLIHCFFRKGGEPPAHFHQLEDETFYVLESEINFHIGDRRFTAKAGDSVFAPRDVPHHFSLETPTAKALLLITPSGIETFFREYSVPAQSLELPPVAKEQPPVEFFQGMMKRAMELGIVWMPEF